MLGVEHLGDGKDGTYRLEDLRLVALADLHPVLHGRDDVLCAVLCTGLGAFLSRPWGRSKTRALA